MIENMLAVRHIEAESLTLRDLTRHLSKPWNARFIRWDSSGQSVPVPTEQVEDAFVYRIEGELRLNVARSAFPLALMIVVAVGGIYLGVQAWKADLRDFAPWNTTSAVALLTVLAVAFISRWLVVINKIRASFLQGDYLRLALDKPVDDVEWDRRSETFKKLRTEWGIEAAVNDEFHVALETTMRTRFLLRDAVLDRVSARYALDNIAKRSLKNLIGRNSGTSYNASAVAFVKLDAVAPHERITLAIAAYVIGLAVLAAVTYGAIAVSQHWLAELGALWMTLVLAPLAVAWTFVALGTVGYLGAALVFAVLIAAGRPWASMYFAQPLYRVRVRTANSRWVALLRTQSQVEAVETFNLVSRDIRRPID